MGRLSMDEFEKTKKLAKASLGSNILAGIQTPLRLRFVRILAFLPFSSRR